MMSVAHTVERFNRTKLNLTIPGHRAMGWRLVWESPSPNINPQPVPFFWHLSSCVQDTNSCRSNTLTMAGFPWSHSISPHARGRQMHWPGQILYQSCKASGLLPAGVDEKPRKVTEVPPSPRVTELVNAHVSRR